MSYPGYPVLYYTQRGIYYNIGHAMPYKPEVLIQEESNKALNKL